MKAIFWLIPTTILCFGCNQNNNPNINVRPKLISIELNSHNGGEPFLYTSNSGEVYLSWVEYKDDNTDVLQFVKWEEDSWSNIKTIASGSDWFVNWADFPSITSYNHDNNSLVAHWLQKSASGTYDYDVHISQSFDGGDNWSASFIPHRDSIAAEHGFVSMQPLNNNRIFVTWLDGRNTKMSKKATGHSQGTHGHGGSMTLRGASFDREGNLSDEIELDNRVCDCCQTSVAMTDKGLIIVYRDRSEIEYRDISIVREIDGKWTEPKPVHEDNWMIAGCPVNGPVASASGSKLAVAWFTMSDEKPKIQLSFSNDSGATFNHPIRLDKGNPIGRVDINWLDKESVLVSWVEEEDEKTYLKAAHLSNDGKVKKQFNISTFDASRKSGFPRMAVSKNHIFFAWTQVDSTTIVRTGRVHLSAL